MTLPFFLSFLDNVLKTVLALFMEDAALPLPSLEEVLICNPNTTTEEVRARVPPSYTIVYTVHEYAHVCRWIICLSLQLPSNQIFCRQIISDHRAT